MKQKDDPVTTTTMVYCCPQLQVRAKSLLKLRTWPLPRDLHHERTVEALTTGNHVLLKKPRGNTAEETSSISTADQFFLRHSTVYLIAVKGCVEHSLLGFTYLAVQWVRAIVDSRELGALKRVEAFHHRHVSIS